MKLLAIIRTTKKSPYDAFDIKGITKLPKLRVNFSALNGHRPRYNLDCSTYSNLYVCVCVGGGG